MDFIRKDGILLYERVSGKLLCKISFNVVYLYYTYMIILTDVQQPYLLEILTFCSLMYE